MAFPVTTVAADTAWAVSANGDFSVPTNWTNGVPSSADRAIFNQPGTYSVSFSNAPASSGQLLVSAGNVTFRTINPATDFGYAIGNTSPSIVVGDTAAATLTLDLATTTNGGVSAGDCVIGQFAGSAGTLNVGQSNNLGTLSLLGPITVGSAGQGSLNVFGTLTGGNAFIASQAGSVASAVVNGGYWAVNGSAVVGNSSNPAGQDTLLVTNGGSLDVSFGNITLNASGTLTLDGFGNIFTINISGGNTSNFKFISGSLSLYNAFGLTMGPSSLLGSTFTLDVNKSLYLAGDLYVPSGTTFNLSGGALEVGSIRRSSGTVNYTGGQLICDSSGITVDSFNGTFNNSASLTLRPGDGLAANGGPLIIGSSASGRIDVDGGYLDSDSGASLGAFTTANGTVTLGTGTIGFSHWFMGNVSLVLGGRMNGSSITRGGVGTILIGPNGQLGTDATHCPTATLFTGSKITLNGGTAYFASLNAGASGAGGTIAYQSGTFSVLSGDLTVGTGGAVPLGFTLNPTDSFFLGGALTLSGQNITVSGGQLEMGQLLRSATEQVIFNSGRVSIDNGSLLLATNGPITPTITLRSTDALAAPSGTVTIATGGSLAIAGGSFTALSLVNNTASPVTYSGGTVNILGDLVLDAFAPTRPFGNTIVINAATATASFSVAGTLTVGAGGAGAQIDVRGGGALSSGTAALASGGGTATVNVGVIGSGIWNASGDVFVGGDAIAAGGTGRVNVGPAGFFGASSPSATNNLLIYPNGHVILNGGTVAFGSIDNTHGGEFQFNSGTINLLASDFVVDTSGPLGATVNLSANQTVTTSTNSGTLIQVGAALTLSGGILQTGSVTNQGTLAFSPTQPTVFATSMGGNGIVSVNGPAPLTLAGNNTYTGGTLLNGGSLNVLTDSNLGDVSSGVTINNATLLSTGTFSTDRSVTLNHANSTIDVSGTNILTINSTLLGSGSLTKGTGIGTLVLAQAGAVPLPNLTAKGGTLQLNGFTVANTLSISNATVQVTSDIPHAVTNTVTTLTISSSNGLLDIGDNDLLVDNTATPFRTIHNNSLGVGKAGTGYWDRGYNYQVSNGFGVWDGSSGLTSATARASHQVDARISVGYIDGKVQNDPNIGDLGIGLATNRILVRPALNGDLNLDGVVDGNDIGIIIGLGYFGTGTAPHGWLDGDVNGDGVVDANDIGIIIGAGTFSNGSYGPTSKAKTAKAMPTLTGRGAVAQTTTVGALGDGQFDYVYDPTTGDVKVNYDGDTRITTTNLLQRLKLASASGMFNPNAVNNSAFNFTTESNTLLDLQQTTDVIPDHYDIGDVLPAGLTGAQVANDLTLQFNVKGGGLGLKTADMVVPEPSGLSLIGIGATGFLTRRRRTGSVARGTRRA